MAVYRFEGPDGRIHRVEATTPEAAQQGLEQHFAKSTPAPADARIDRGAMRALADPRYANAAAAAAAKTAELGGQGRGGGRALVQGATFGFGDELAGLAGGVETAAGNLVKRMTGREIPYTAAQYRAALTDSERAAQSSFERENPGRNFAAQLIGGAVGGAKLGQAAMGGAKWFGGVVGRSAVLGGVTGGVAGAGYSEGDIGKRLPGTAKGAAIGTAIGAATPVAIRAAQAIPGMVRGAAPVNEPAAMAEAADALQEAGIDVRQVSTVAMGRLGDLIRQGRNPREAALAVVASTDLPVPVPMARGQRTGDPGQQLSENLMLRGARGTAAANQMRGLVAEQQDALRGNVAAITDTVAGGAPTARGAAGMGVSERLNSMFDAAKSGVDDAYNAARAVGEGARLPREQAPILGATLRESVSTFDPVRVPSVVRELDRIDNIAGSGSVTVRDLFDARARLSNLRASADTVEAAAARKASGALDSYINGAVTDDLLTGDPKTVSLWREAIRQRREFGRLFESGDLIEALTERAPRGGEMRALRVDAGDATNYILGRSDMGFVGKQNLYRDLTRLREVLGAQSQEWNGIRAEVFQRLGSQGEGAVEFGQRQFSGVKFQKAWNDFVRKDARLASELFSVEERATIDRFATIAARVTSPVKGGDNAPNTAVAAARLLGNLRFLRGLPFIKEMASELEVQANLGAARQATSPALGPALRPRAPVPPVSRPAVSAAVPGASGYAASRAR